MKFMVLASMFFATTSFAKDGLLSHTVSDIVYVTAFDEQDLREFFTVGSGRYEYAKEIFKSKYNFDTRCEEYKFTSFLCYDTKQGRRTVDKKEIAVQCHGRVLCKTLPRQNREE